MRIDAHAHYWTDGYLDLLVELGKASTATQRGIGAGGGAELDSRLGLMDRAGVDGPSLRPATSTTSTPRWYPRIRIDSARTQPRQCRTSTHR
ncbi:MAG: 6-methylsalicylate decarboxylase [Mycobacterium sp.]|jgi:hypothetical protein|nr:6-methylsalicylate decarboxylase [Mycobacterium sp.]